MCDTVNNLVVVLNTTIHNTLFQYWFDVQPFAQLIMTQNVEVDVFCHQTPPRQIVRILNIVRDFYQAKRVLIHL